MKYRKRTLINGLMDKYEHILVWGTGPLMKMNYLPHYFPAEAIIDGTGKQCGTEYKGIPIKDESYLDTQKGKILVVIYAIYEKQIMDQISRHNPDRIDTIIYSLLDIEFSNGSRRTEIHAKSCEDMLLLMLTRQLHMEAVRFLEIGVCHPVMRNNTYLLYEQFSHMPGYQGVLVEANPLCWDLICEYREQDMLIRKGVRGGGADVCDKKLPFYVFPDLLGHSTFDGCLANEKKTKHGQDFLVIDVEVDDINTIIEGHFVAAPDILALDAEGLDYEILQDWDHRKYPFKIIVSEMMADNECAITELMTSRGYMLYARTVENAVWVRSDQKLSI